MTTLLEHLDETERRSKEEHEKYKLRREQIEREKQEELTRQIRHLELLEISVANGSKHLEVAAAILSVATLQTQHLESIADSLQTLTEINHLERMADALEQLAKAYERAHL